MNGYPPISAQFNSIPYRIYDMLKSGPLTTKEIAAVGGRSHTRRISRLRELLKPHGWTVESKPLGHIDGELQYKYWLSETLPLWEVA
jgi:hypothetical protein